MEYIAGWIAPFATILAAMMTASNLGPRVTGWGFVVFLVGSLAWTTVGIATGQANLLWANGFLTIVNVVGIWRWLGRQARFGDGARAAEQASRRAPAPALFSVGSIADGEVKGADGGVIGRGVDAMAECDSGRISYLVVREGGAAGVGERLHALGWKTVRRCDGGFDTGLDAAALAALPVIEDQRWPARAPA